MQISVVIPTYNRWPTVCRAIESVLDQTRPAEQILVVDDGSTDDTCARLKTRFGNNITVLAQPNKGVSAARNHAIKHASGDWVALLDSDDEWLPEKLQRQIEAVGDATNLTINAAKNLATNLPVEPIQNPVLVHTEEIWIRNGVRVNAAKKHAKRGGHIYQHCLPLCCISPSSALIRKEILVQFGGFDETLPACEDYDLWLRLCARHPVIFIEQPLLNKYGGHNDQLSRKYWGMDRFRIQALEKILKTGLLPDIEQHQTIDMLLHKARIMRKGAIKHCNAEMINHCDNIINLYSKQQRHG